MTYPAEEYRLIPDPQHPEKWCVELIGKKWRGIIYTYGEFEFKEPKNPENPLALKFEREIIYIPPKLRGKKMSEEEGNELIKLLGDILVDILNKNLSDAATKEDKLVLEISKDEFKKDD